jgi:zinc transporter 1/2/3
VSPEGTSLGSIKLLLGAAVLAAGALGGLVPLRGGLRAGRGLAWGSSFAAGVFLGAGLIHMLPGANEAWQALGWSYPIGFLLAAMGFVLMLLVEHVLLPESAHEMLHAPSMERFEHGAGTERASAFTAYVVLVALSVHALVEGLALGAESELAGVLVIFLAIVAHKLSEGFALGVSLVRHPMPAARAWRLLALFSLATPIGIALGTAAGTTLEGATRLAFEAGFLSLAAGTFAYVATLDILRDEPHDAGLRWSRWLLAGAGTGLMALLAIWI